MDGSLSEFVPHAVVLMVGGLGTSLGATHWGRTPRGRAWLVELSRFRWISVFVLALAGGPVVAFLTVRALLLDVGPSLLAVPLWPMLILGVAVGLPMAVPGLAATRAAEQNRRQTLEKWSDRAPTPEDRREYANELEEMMRELSPADRRVVASVSGDGGDILRFEGEMPSVGEKLTSALRDDLKAIGFTRVEGSQGGKDWWTRV